MPIFAPERGVAPRERPLEINLELALYRSKLVARNFQLKEAEQEKKAVQSSPKNRFVCHVWALFEANQGDIEKGWQLLKIGHAVNPRDPVLLHSLALLEYKHSAVSLARVLFRRASEIDPRHRPLWFKAVQSSPKNRFVWHVWALFEANQGDIEKGWKLLKIGHALNPRDLVLLHSLALLEYKNSAVSLARGLFRRASEIDPRHRPLWFMCIFFLPPTAVIPLHNHPEMTVFSKLLLGKLHVKSDDWVDDSETTKCAPSAQSRLAKIVADSDFTAPCKSSILYPTTGGNIHTFRAITPCAVLDILGPPYSKEDDRDCTYYKDHPYADIADGDPTGNGDSNGSFCWLEEIDLPKDLKMDGIEYLGPQIIEV